MSLTHMHSTSLLAIIAHTNTQFVKVFSRGEAVGLKVKLRMVVLWSERLANIIHKMEFELDKTYGIIPVFFYFFFANTMFE